MSTVVRCSALHVDHKRSTIGILFTIGGDGTLRGALALSKEIAQRQLPKRRHHAVIVVAEGAGQEILQAPTKLERDASGNLRLKDIGVFLRDEITRDLKGRGLDFSIKYIDPSYIIRSLPANAVDSEFCLILGQYAAHAGMAGYTDMVIGYWNHHFTHVPIRLAVAHRRQLDPQGPEWHRVLQATGQPALMIGNGEHR